MDVLRYHGLNESKVQQLFLQRARRFCSSQSPSRVVVDVISMTSLTPLMISCDPVAHRKMDLHGHHELANGRWGKGLRFSWETCSERLVLIEIAINAMEAATQALGGHHDVIEVDRYVCQVTCELVHIKYSCIVLIHYCHLLLFKFILFQSLIYVATFVVQAVIKTGDDGLDDQVPIGKTAGQTFRYRDLQTSRCPVHSPIRSPRRA